VVIVCGIFSLLGLAFVPSSRMANERTLRHFPYRNTASKTLQEFLGEHCVIFLIGTIKDFDAVIALLDSNQPPQPLREPCVRVIAAAMLPRNRSLVESKNCQGRTEPHSVGSRKTRRYRSTQLPSL
jgi:hypothetical protein